MRGLAIEELELVFLDRVLKAKLALLGIICFGIALEYDDFAVLT